MLQTIRWWLRKPKWAWQRLTRGWDDTATWSMDTYIAGLLADMLAEHRRVAHGYPMRMDSFEEWETILKQMEEDFRFYTVHKFRWDGAAREADQRITRALTNLRFYFRDLWD